MVMHYNGNAIVRKGFGGGGKGNQKGGGGGAAAPVLATSYATTLYTGDGTTSKAVNAINLTSGGVIIQHRRDAAADTRIVTYDGSTVRGFNVSNTSTFSAPAVTFTSSGYTLTDTAYNVNTATYLSYAFAKKPRFVDVVYYTGNGAASRAISHNLQCAVGRIIVSRVDGVVNATSPWMYDRVVAANDPTTVESVSSFIVTSNSFANSVATTTQFFVDGSNNTNAVSYVAVLFAHDTGSGNIIQVLGWTGNASSSGPTISYGWQPQSLVLMRRWNGSSSTTSADNARTPGFSGATARAYLSNNTLADDTGWGTAVTLVSGGWQVTAPSADINQGNFTAIAISS